MMYVWDEDLCDYIEMDQAGIGAGSTYAGAAVPNVTPKGNDMNILPGMTSNKRKKKKQAQPQGPLETIEGNPSGGSTSTS
jgi:hypothetical protein